jgi:hypothetical protein
VIRLRQAIQPTLTADAAAMADMSVPASAADKPVTPATAYGVAWLAAAAGIGGGILIADLVRPAPLPRRTAFPLFRSSTLPPKPSNG